MVLWHKNVRCENDGPRNWGVRQIICQGGPLDPFETGMDLKGENSYRQLIPPLQQGKSVVVGAGIRAEERKGKIMPAVPVGPSALPSTMPRYTRFK